MKVAENVLLRYKEDHTSFPLIPEIGREYICPTLFGYVFCKITKIGDMGHIWAESEGSLFLIEAVENGLQQCLQIDKTAIEKAEF